MKEYRLDRTAFKIKTFQEASQNKEYWLTRTPKERLNAAWYLICSAYNLDVLEYHKLDRTAFEIRKRE